MSMVNHKTLTITQTHLSGSMSSAIILNNAFTNLFWSTAIGGPPMLELGLKLNLEGRAGLGQENSLLDAKVCGGRTAGCCLVF